MELTESQRSTYIGVLIERYLRLLGERAIDKKKGVK